MQIFKNKKWLTGIEYKDRGEYFKLSDKSVKAKKIKAGADFEIDWKKKDVKIKKEATPKAFNERSFEDKLKQVSRLSDKDIKEMFKYINNKLSIEK